MRRYKEKEVEDEVEVEIEEEVENEIDIEKKSYITHQCLTDVCGRQSFLR